MVGLLLPAFDMDVDIKEEFTAVRTEVQAVRIAEGLIALDAKVEAMRDSR